MKKNVGKNQSYCREINFELVINLLRQKPHSATQLADILQLSNATMSSIVKDLLDMKMIVVSESLSIKGSGRKQVFYELNSKFGLILVVNIAHRSADISVTNIKEECIASETMAISDINEVEVQKVILKATQLLFTCQNEATLKNIIISMTGLVKDETETSEKHFVQAAFEKQFHGVPTYLTNDGNLISYGELSKGVFSKEKNGIMMLVDYGIGGSFVINQELFRGDNGFAGEMGNQLCEENGTLQYLEDVASLRVLMNKAEAVVNRKVKMEDLFELYRSNKEVHDIVLKSAEAVAKALRSMTTVLDIRNVVISGRVMEFGDEYLNIIKKEVSINNEKTLVQFSPLGYQGPMIGGAYIGVDYILKKSLEKK